MRALRSLRETFFHRVPYLGTVAAKIASYLRHETSLAALVDWAERAFMDADFDSADTEVLANVIARLCAGDVRAFGLTWEDCEAALAALGFTARVEVVAA